MFHRPALRGLGVVCMLLAMTFVLVSAAPAMAFPDVPDNHAYARAIDELSSRGIIGGYTDGNFGLDDPVKRAQFAKMIVAPWGSLPTPQRPPASPTSALRMRRAIRTGSYRRPTTTASPTAPIPPRLSSHHGASSSATR